MRSAWFRKEEVSSGEQRGVVSRVSKATRHAKQRRSCSAQPAPAIVKDSGRERSEMLPEQESITI
jgi:hypothetical protein